MLQERDGVVAALRMQLRQRQQAMVAETSGQPVMVAAGQVEAENAQNVAGGVAALLTGPDLPSEYAMPSPEVSIRAAELEALWTSSASPAR